MAEQAFIIPRGEGFPVQVSPVITDTSTGGLGLSDGGALASLFIPLLLLGLIPSMMMPMTKTTTCPACPGCTTPVPCSPMPTCPTGFMKLTFGEMVVPNKCYLFSKTPKAFYEHLIACNSLGGNLLNIGSVTEANAVVEYLNTNDPNVEYYIGYTDFVSTDPVKAIAGGPVPIPILGNPPEDGHRNCITMKVKNNANTFQSYKCKLADTKNGICDIDLTKQKCVCP